MAGEMDARGGTVPDWVLGRYPIDTISATNWVPFSSSPGCILLVRGLNGRCARLLVQEAEKGLGCVPGVRCAHLAVCVFRSNLPHSLIVGRIGAAFPREWIVTIADLAQSLMQGVAPRPVEVRVVLRFAVKGPECTLQHEAD
jgi:hypothetical protein